MNDEIKEKCSNCKYSRQCVTVKQIDSECCLKDRENEKKDEIKEINIPENVLVALSDLTNGALNYYKATETVKVRHNTIFDYITNLQEKVDQYENPDDLTLFYMWLDEKAKDKMKQLEKENKKLQDRNIELVLERDRLKEELQQEKKDFKEANDYCFELKDYKSRNEKAIEYMQNNDLSNFDSKLYYILTGDDKDE